MGLMFLLKILLTGSRFKALLLEGERFLHRDKPMDSLRIFREVTEVWPTAPEGYDGLNRTFLAMGFRPEAQREGNIAEALKSLKDDPNNFKAQYDLAKGFFEKELYGWAATHIDNALSLRPEDIEANALAAKIFRLNKNYSKAAKILRRSLSREPFEGDSYEQLAFCLRAMGKPQEALKAASLSKLLKEVAADLLNPDPVSKAAYQFVNTSQPDLAEQLVERALSLNPDQPELLRLKGELLILDRKVKEAAEVLQHSVDLDPTDVMAHKALAKAYNALGDKVQALKHLEMARTMEQAQSKGSRAENLLAALKMYLESGQLKQAIEAHAEMKKRYPHDWRVFYAQGLILRNQKELEKALKSFQAASKLETNEPRIFLSAAEIYSDMDQPRLAVAEARRAVELAPRDASIRHFLSGILKKHGYMEKAIEEEDIAASLIEESK